MRGQLKIRDVQEEALRPLNARLEEPAGRVARAEPIAVSSVEVDQDIRLEFKAIDGRVELSVPIRWRGSREVIVAGIFGLASFRLAAEVDIVRNDPQAVRLEQNDCLAIAYSLAMPSIHAA
jgi:hypothetical protein